MGHREESLRLMRLTPEDLEANRAGLLSQRQARSIVQSGLRNLLGALVIGLALAAILYAVASKPLALAAAVLIVGYVDYHRTRLERPIRGSNVSGGLSASKGAAARGGIWQSPAAPSSSPCISGTCRTMLPTASTSRRRPTVSSPSSPTVGTNTSLIPSKFVAPF
jgi:hypothetical protein